jgi:hypothetical protein
VAFAWEVFRNYSQNFGFIWVFGRRIERKAIPTFKVTPLMDTPQLPYKISQDLLITHLIWISETRNRLRDGNDRQFHCLHEK